MHDLASPEEVTASGDAPTHTPGSRTRSERRYGQQPRRGRAEASRQGDHGATPVAAGPAPDDPFSLHLGHNGDGARAPADGAKAGTAPKRPGSAIVVGSAEDTEEALDDSFTPALVRALQRNPKLSVAEVLGIVADKALQQKGHVHHPTAARYGQAQHAAKSARHAVLIPNQHYDPLPSLGTPIAEADALKGELGGRGWKVQVHQDQTAAAMGSLWQGMVDQAAPGDDLLAYYGGHGLPQGLAGVTLNTDDFRDVFTNAQITGVVNAATTRGANIRFVMDSCHSGAAVEATREERSNQLKRDGAAGDASALQDIEALKHKLVTALQERAEGMAAIAARGNRASAASMAAELDSVTRQVIDALWKEIVTALSGKVRRPPPPITDYDTLGDQLNFLDQAWNATEPATAAPTPAKR